MSHTCVIPDVLWGAPSLAQGTDLNALEKEISAMSIWEPDLMRISEVFSGPTFLKLSRTPFWRILVIWSLNSNLEHPGVRRSLPWKSIYFHRALIVQGFPVFWVQLISLSLGEAVQDVKMVASVLPKAASSGYIIPVPKAFLQGCLHILAVILGTQSYLSLLASTGLDSERGESIAWPNARGF